MGLKERLFLPLTTGTALALLIGGAGAYLSVAQLRQRAAAPPAEAALIPENALLAVTLATNRQTWEQLVKLGTANTRQAVAARFDSWHSSLVEATGYRFSQDVQPWLGPEITWALLPSAAGSSPDTVEQLLLLPVTASEKLPPLLEQANDGTPWPQRQYRGVSIRSIPHAEQSWEMALLEQRWVALSNGPAGIEAAVDALADEEPTLLGNDRYRQSLQRLGQPGVVAQLYARADAAALLGWELPGFEGLAATVAFAAPRVTVAASSWLDPAAGPIYGDLSNAFPTFPEELPISTLFLISGRHIAQLWSMVQNADRLRNILPLSPQALEQEFEQRTAIDLENDVLPLLAEETTLALLSPIEDSPLGIDRFLLLGQVEEKDVAQGIWQQLDRTLQERYQFTIKSDTENDIAATYWQSPFQTTQMAYGWLDENRFFWGLGEDITDELAPSGAASLERQPLVRRLLKQAPRDQAGYLFLDLAGLRQIDTPTLSIADGPVARNIDRFGLSVRVNDEQSLDYLGLIDLARPR